MRLLRPLSLVLLVLGLSVGILPLKSARAQSGPMVSIEPATIQVGLNETATINVAVSNITSLFAFDVLIKYDPTLVSVSQVTAGSFLYPGFVIVKEVNEQQGTVHFATTQLNPSTPKSSSGVLLSITLNGLQLGMGGLSITAAQLANVDGQLTTTSIKDGHVEISRLPSVTPSSTSTPTLKLTATYTPIPSATSTPLPSSTFTRQPTASNTPLPSATPTLQQPSSTVQTSLTSNPTVIPTHTPTWKPTAMPAASLTPDITQTQPGSALVPHPTNSSGLVPISTTNPLPQDPSTTPPDLLSTLPTMVGGGLLTPEPIETGAPPSPIVQNEDTTFWIVLIALALLAVVLLAGILRNYQRKSTPR